MDIFEEWGELTKVFFSTRIALDREANLWKSIEIAKPEDVELEVLHGQRKYAVDLPDHVRVLSDEHPLCALVLSLSYALLEAYARFRLGPGTVQGGIEAWAKKLLDLNGLDWADVFGSKQGLIEVAVARNALAHGALVTREIHDRFTASGCTCPWAVGTTLRLEFDVTNVYRDRLRSLIRVTQPVPAPATE
jgi:hypothetical protein